MRRIIFTILLLPLALFSREIDTFYGPIEVEEPLLLELIDCPAMQRLKEIHQYGVSYYTTHREEYSRYDHSLGVFVILRAKGCSLKEQVAGLLHDVSHTIFSHVGDWMFNLEYQEKDYQNQIYCQFLRKRGVADILEKYGISVEDIEPTGELFPALECSLPNLCADRLDYNIQGAYHQRFLTHDEAMELLESLEFNGSIWVSDRPDLMKKLVQFSLFMSEDCWGSPRNHFQSRYLADAILRALDLGALSIEDVHFGADQVVWNMLKSHSDPVIRNNMLLLEGDKQLFTYVEAGSADQIIRAKFRGVDPWIQTEEGVFRICELDPDLASQYQSTKDRFEIGWPIKVCLNKE
ncbi:MAG: HD domain-containing protein [Simkaniaceae bacterium]|nr:HD domain-containing protein [Candidatus Sacchlamyda saccharinae]